MFQRQGIVRVALEQGEDFDERLEKLIETALEAGAEDFEQLEPSEGTVEIEVYFPTTHSCVRDDPDMFLPSSNPRPPLFRP